MNTTPGTEPEPRRTASDAAALTDPRVAALVGATLERALTDLVDALWADSFSVPTFVDGCGRETRSEVVEMSDVLSAVAQIRGRQVTR